MLGILEPQRVSYMAYRIFSAGYTVLCYLDYFLLNVFLWRPAGFLFEQIAEIFVQQIFKTGQNIPAAFAARDKLPFVSVQR